MSEKSSPLYYSNEQVHLLCDDVLTTSEIADESIDLVVTSPPYNLDIQYNSHRDDLSYNDYLAFSRLWLERAYHWLKNDGRMYLNHTLRQK